MKTSFSDRGWDDYLALLEADPKLLRGLNRIIEECKRSPFAGIGRPEFLNDNLKGWWSRRPTEERRLVSRVGGVGSDQLLEIAQCRFHY